MFPHLLPSPDFTPDIADVFGPVLIAALYEEGETVEDMAERYQIEPAQLVAYGEAFAARFVKRLQAAPCRKRSSKDLNAELARARAKFAASEARLLRQLRRARQG